MDSHSRSKINQLLTNWPKGAVGPASWLRDQGVSRQLADTYRKTSWLRRLAHGAYVRADDVNVDWTGAVWSMQKLLHMSVHPGGKTALELHGEAHFLPLGGGRLTLYGETGERLPVWFRTHNWNVKVLYTATNLFPRDLGLTEHIQRELPLQVSSRERAFMELLHLVPRKESLGEARLLMEGLATLRPALVQRLLETCNSVKVKRLFLVLADEARHPWVNKLDLSNTDLGKGKRVLIKGSKGGRLHPKYQLVLPVDSERDYSVSDRP
ncbi:MAG: type IV toxin-antitoxin system AbiEi family antitoxin domain-containing protein [Betaproteobacteria bacterium]